MSFKANNQPPEFAIHWARELGSSEKSLVQLQGGINNRVFRCGEAHNQWVIKGYSPLEPDQRDRMQAEVDFLRYSAQVAPGFTPELIHSDPKLRCVVLEYLEGKSFTEGVPPPEESVDTAEEFFRRLNADPKAAKCSIHMDAAEGFLRLTEHLDNVHFRLGSMECNHLPAEARPEAERLLAILRSELERIREITANQISSGEIVDAISPDSRCVSPSDFGFHNAIQTSTGVRFLDFEFAGWDDPAKSQIDFFLQPKVPTKSCLNFLFPIRNGELPRYFLMFRILQLKWSCIRLNFLKPKRSLEIEKIVGKPTYETSLKKILLIIFNEVNSKEESSLKHFRSLVYSKIGNHNGV